MHFPGSPGACCAAEEKGVLGSKVSSEHHSDVLRLGCMGSESVLLLAFPPCEMCVKSGNLKKARSFFQFHGNSNFSERDCNSDLTVGRTAVFSFSVVFTQKAHIEEILHKYGENVAVVGPL